MNQSQLQEVLKNHKMFLEMGGGVRANLSDADLRDADLRGADLRYADLRGADLYGANLRGANLRGANLSRAYLMGADLSHADLRDADLRDADLRHADLRYACLSRANLRHADLSDADLRDAYLWDVIGNKKEIFTFKIKKYTVVIYQDRVQIGCKNFSIEQWFSFSDDEISSMDDGALGWWNAHKEHVKQFYKIANN